MTVLVSACLLGFPCRPDGADKRSSKVLEALRDEEVVPVCPEFAGGLGVPRLPAWQHEGRIVDTSGNDVTALFAKGAEIAVEAALGHRVSLAILKQNSPSCGTKMTGTSRGRQPGMGLAARALAEAGIEVRGEDEA
jgi:uncharacterized protein YbbK (DUF523 family)